MYITSIAVNNDALTLFLQIATIRKPLYSVQLQLQLSCSGEPTSHIYVLLFSSTATIPFPPVNALTAPAVGQWRAAAPEP